jgi:hypothetical protein
MTKYMHTIDREPGFFDGYQICFAGRRSIKLCDTLAQIRSQQKLSRRNRLADKWPENFKYDYVRIHV